MQRTILQGIFCGALTMVMIGGEAVAIAPLPLSAPIKVAQAESEQDKVQRLLAQGKKSYESQDFQRAREIFGTATDIAQGSQQWKQAGLAFSFLALVEVKLGRFEGAAIALERGAAIAQKISRPARQGLQARLALGRGELALAQGEGQRAISQFQNAAQIYGATGDRVGALGAALNQAEALQSLGFYRRSLRLLLQQRSQLAVIAEQSPAVAMQGWLSLGHRLRQLGQFEEALQSLGRSQDLAREIWETSGEDSLRAEIDLSLGQTHLAIARRARLNRDGTLARTSQLNALKFLQRSAMLGRSPASKLKANLTLMEAEQFPRRQVSEGEREKFLRHWLGLRSPLEQMAPGRQSVELGLRWVRFGMDRFEGAVGRDAVVVILRRLATQAERIGDGRSQSQVLGTLGEIYSQAGRRGEARELWRRSLQLAHGANAPETAYRWHWLLGKNLAKGGDREGALVQYRRAFQLIQQLRKNLVGMSETVQFSFRDRVEPVYRELTALLLKGKPNQQELSEARQIIEALQLARLDNFFRQACLDVEPEFLDRTIDRQTDAASIYSIVLEDSVASIVKRPGASLEHFVVSVPKVKFDQTLRQLFRSFQNPALPTRYRLGLSQKVYQWLLAPVVPALEKANIKTLVMVLDGELGNIPVAALYDGDRYVIEKFNLARSPSLQLLPPSTEANTNLSVAVAGISEDAPSFIAEGLADLPFVGLELAAIGDRFPGKVLSNEKVTQGALRSEILWGRNNIIHIATHAQFSSNADQTFLLTWDRRIGVDELDLLLQPGDRRDAIELLVLSACETASGDPRASLGLTGIAIQAGARSVLGTLWQVSDASTAELMARFYDYLQGGMTKAEALSQAQRDLIKDPEFRHPFYWAPYILVGNWR